MNTRRTLRSNAGFSLIEVLIVVAIFAGMIFVVAAMRKNISGLEKTVNQQLKTRRDIDATLQTIITDIRSAGLSGSGSYAIESAASTSLVFYSDVDQDGAFERVRYAIGTSTVIRGVVEPTGNPVIYPTSTESVATMVYYVVPSTSTPLFAYYDANYTGSQTALTEPIDITKIRAVSLNLFVDIEPGKSPKPLFFSHTITIRNLRTN
jgi:prepilin-type N-terminal cleavage/methylation domain-containing protein